MSINPRNYKWTDNVETRWIDLAPLRTCGKLPVTWSTRGSETFVIRRDQVRTNWYIPVYLVVVGDLVASAQRGLLIEPLRSFVSKEIGGGSLNAGLYQIPVISYICEYLERYLAVIPREP